MEDDTNNALNENLDPMVWRVSWFGFVETFVGILFAWFVFLFIWFVLTGFFKLTTGGVDTSIFTVILVLAMAWVLITRLLFTRSIRLIVDDEGVWVFSGIFPWSRGTTGVKWELISDATMSIGFVSWLSKSHNIRVHNRFNRKTEISLSSIQGGDEAIDVINELASKYQRG